MNYWKQFRLSTLAKARAIEFFTPQNYGTLLVFTPYPLPSQKHSKKHFFDYVNFPLKTVMVKQEELFKLRQHGGTKLINIQAKSEASKIKWLIELCVLPKLKTHMDLITRLMGDQKERCNGRDLFFTTTHYARRILRIDSPFYKESITAMTTLELRKQVLDPRAEKLFYNPSSRVSSGTH